MTKEEITENYIIHFGLEDMTADELGSGDKTIIEWGVELVKKLNIHNVSKSFYCETKRGCLEQCDGCALTELAKNMAC